MCDLGCYIKQHNTWPLSKTPSVSHQPPCCLHTISCVVTPFPVRLACLANLPQCLHVNLTSWQAHWSASRWHDWQGALFCNLAAAFLKSLLSGWQRPGSAKEGQMMKCVYNAKSRITAEKSLLLSWGTLSWIIFALTCITLGISALNNLQNHRGVWNVPFPIKL